MIYTSLHEADTDMSYTDYTGGEAMPAAATALSGFFIWLRLWMLQVADGVLTDLEDRFYSRNFHYGLSAAQIRQGYQRPRSLLPESMRAATEPGIVYNRSETRMVRRGLPPSRLYTGLNHLNARQLTLAQFRERACRLSVGGRVVIYRLVHRKRLCQRRDEICHIGGSFGLASSGPMVTLKPP